MLLCQLFELRRNSTSNILFEARVDFLRTKFIPLIAAGITSQTIDIPSPLNNLIGATAEESAAKVFDYVLQCDPEPQKKSVQWLLTQLVKGNFLLEDGDKANEYIKLFQENKHRLPTEQRDINRIKSIGDLYTIIEPLRTVPAEISQRQMDKRVDNHMHEQAKVMLNTPEYKIVVPLTKEASCYFGINTQWCTAASNSYNYFDHYNKSGPLYIILDKKNNKRWQFQLGQQPSYMDEADRPINIIAFLTAHPPVDEFFAQMDGPPLATATVHGEPYQVFSIADTPERLKNRIGIEQVTYEIKKAPGLMYKPIISIWVREGVLYQIRSKGQSDALMSQPEMVKLLTELKIAGDPNAQASGATYLLAYRDGRWGSFYELAKPFIKMKGGWTWMHMDSEGLREFFLMSPLPMPHAKSEFIQIGEDRSFADATLSNGEFYVSSIRGHVDKRVAPSDRTIISPMLLRLILKLKNVDKWTHNKTFGSVDLLPEDAKILAAKRPELCEIATLYKLYGLTDIVKGKVEAALDEEDVGYIEWIDQQLMVQKWDDISDCIKDIGSDHAKWLNKLSDGMERFEHEWTSASASDIKTFLDDLKPEDQAALLKWTKEKYAAQLESYFEDQGYEEGEGELANMRDLADFAEEHVDEIRDAASHGMLTGSEVGAENEAQKNLNKAIESAGIVFYHGNEWSHDLMWDVPVGLLVPAEQIMRVIDNNEVNDLYSSGWADYLEIKIDADEPYNGYNDYDDEAAQERFKEELPRFEEFE